MASLVEITNSGASVEVILELMAKQLEKRLQALEQGGKALYVSEVEKALAGVMSEMSKVKTNITVKAAEQQAPVVNVTPSVTVMEKEKEPKTIKMTFERNLANQIESATITKE